MGENDILLESGTNELEIVEFTIGNVVFGINVIKVREIIVPPPVNPVPLSHPHLEGVTVVRGEVIPVINLAGVLDLEQTKKNGEDKLIISEFNKMMVIFRVDDVSLIRRISWEDIDRPSDLYQVENRQLVGIVQLQEKIILLPDFEKIITDISPESGLNADRISDQENRKQKNTRIIIAEDSLFIQNILQEVLEAAGYTNLTFFSNGKQVLEYFAEEGWKQVDLVITDIEMPQMDGHHLTRRIKESEEMNHLPVVIFSSLITEDLRHKGEKVGADAQVSKPEADQLVDIIDELVHQQSTEE
jgi:two-component system chemotaxis response regulator CheV